MPSAGSTWENMQGRWQGARTSVSAAYKGSNAQRLLGFAPIKAGIQDVQYSLGFGRLTVFGDTAGGAKGLGAMSYGLFNPAGYEIGGINLETSAQKIISRHAARGEAMGTARAYGRAGKHVGKAFSRAGWGARAGFVGKTAARALGPAFVAYSAYAGYKEGGVWGATKEVATTLAFGFAISAGLSAAGITASAAAAVAVPAAIIAGAGYATYKALEAGNAKIDKSRSLEMGSPLVDPFGTAATMRQRSLQQLMFSQINGRSAFGTEASLMHIPMMR